MEVDFNSGYSPMAGLYQPGFRQKPFPTTAGDIRLTARAKVLERAIRDSHRVRPEKVAEACVLAADAGYPSDELLRRMADLLARNIIN